MTESASCGRCLSLIAPTIHIDCNLQWRTRILLEQYVEFIVYFVVANIHASIRSTGTYTRVATRKSLLQHLVKFVPYIRKSTYRPLAALSLVSASISRPA